MTIDPQLQIGAGQILFLTFSVFEASLVVGSLIGVLFRTRPRVSIVSILHAKVNGA